MRWKNEKSRKILSFPFNNTQPPLYFYIFSFVRRLKLLGRLDTQIPRKFSFAFGDFQWEHSVRELSRQKKKKRLAYSSFMYTGFLYEIILKRWKRHYSDFSPLFLIMKNFLLRGRVRNYGYECTLAELFVVSWKYDYLSHLQQRIS